MTVGLPPGLTLWFDPGFGASGDMLLGALVGLLGTDEPLTALDHLGLDDVRSADSIEQSTVIRCHLASTRVVVAGGRSDAARTWSDIDALIAAAPLSDRVRDGARSTFRLLGEIEADQHGVEIDDVHFHEVGAVDAIIDVVGAWLLVDAIAPARIVSGPVGLGHGTVRAAHGLLPLPAPATLALLNGRPVRPLDHEGETCTPTGAALLRSMAHEWTHLPPGHLVASARGAGRRDPATHPNVLTVVAVDPGPAPANGRIEPAVLLETNLDDVTPEVVARTVDQLLADGADDAWVVPITMKKGRPGHQLRVLTSPARMAALRDRIASETGTLGVRVVPVDKHVLPRRIETIELHGHPVRVKVGPHRSKPEYDDLVAVSDATGIPVRTLAAEVTAAEASGHTLSP